MDIPGFTAQAVLVDQSRYRARRVTPISSQPIHPATFVDQNCLRSCQQDCGSACAGEAGQAKSACVKSCSSDNASCVSTCTVAGDPPPPPTGGGTPAPSFECQLEETFHPLGTELLDKGLRILMSSGKITSKSQCYTAMKAPAAIIGAAAGASAKGLGSPFSEIIGAVAGYNIDTLGQCICDRYF
jgi:hypothetical protein